MTRKPVHESRDNRQLIWEALKSASGPMTRTELQVASKVAASTVAAYLKALVAGGIVDKAEDQGRSTYRILRDTGFHAPRLKADGTPVKTGGAGLNLWRSMRMLKQFSARDLAAHSTTTEVDTTENHAKVYCSHLLAAGYLKVVQKAAPPKRAAIYRLIRDTGPVPPKTQRVHQVYDPNTGEVHFTGGAR
ncbi:MULTISPECIES: hypothetical protein [unclassified Paracoccus (in: a-proteobacteria)]|uniref:hypothetical protein n=1 Tax=unclassified Paracoccus (in: a-proteobacteria) TaxID=2688777 RepID=UPI0012B1A6E2|nr:MULTISPECIES: hypothetical protein [unclassified Paracoccus (in: a-proteobacteria)]UXU74334.1 hypothetical protein GB879_010535 [Paracoccus sp. SMMA_5]UXU80224.1 hypothetical protein GB880_010510 [Paracoccus sp. SMMA_5_TC]